MFHPPSREATAGEPEPVYFSEIQRGQIHLALEQLLASPPLRTTQQCQQLLRYIVENSLLGNLAQLRERVIGKEVFHRRSAYDPGEDPVVRVRAADLRKRLALHYQAQMWSPAVRIEIPSGSYRAHFIWLDDERESRRAESAEPAPLPPAKTSSERNAIEASVEREIARVLDEPVSEVTRPAEAEAAVVEKRSGRSQWLLRLVVTSLALFALAGSLVWRYQFADPVRRFWAPLLSDAKPVLLSIGSNAVYRMDDTRADAYARQTSQGNEGMEFFPSLQPDQPFSSTGLHPSPDSFVALGDVAATSEMVRTLTSLGKNYEERFPNDISFAEIREHASVLIGGFNNPMTRELTRDLPFVMSQRNRIDDRQHPGTAWVLQASSDSHDTEDYAILTRLTGTKDAFPLLVVAGMGQYGTVAATDFVCKPESLRTLFAAAGPHWRDRNLQVVLRIKVIDFKPVRTSIVAVRLW